MKRVTKSVEVNAPVYQCYDMWTRFTEFPQFMHNVQSVTKTSEPGVWHWKVNGPMGQSVEYDARWDLDEPNRRISWHTVGDENLDMRGDVGFADLGSNRTQVTVNFYLSPPGGPLGNAVAAVFSDPGRMVQEDLENFRQRVEGSKAVR